MRKISTLTKLASLLFVLIFVLTACSERDVWEDALYTEDTTLGKGASTFTFEVKVNEHLVTFTVNTDESLLGNALLDCALISGTYDTYGLYVKYVNGIRADYDRDGKYWSLYVNGDYATSGVDTIEISSGACYRFEYSK